MAEKHAMAEEKAITDNPYAQQKPDIVRVHTIPTRYAIGPGSFVLFRHISVEHSYTTGAQPDLNPPRIT